jgi:hypothetical protein
MNPTGGQVPYNIQGLSKQTVTDAVRKGFNAAQIGNRDEYMPLFTQELLPDADLAQIMVFIGAK